MRLRDYLADRLSLLVGFALAVLFLLAVVHLAVARLNLADTAYLLLLGTVSVAVCLAFDYLSQRAFRRAVADRLAGRFPAGVVDGTAPETLPPPRTREQRAMVALLAAARRSSWEELRRLRLAGEQHRAFVDLWVHHMKTPLAVLELIVRDHAADEDWRSVGEEVDELGHGLELMLTTSRLDRFELDLEPKTVDLAALARACVNELRRSWVRAGVYPRVEAPTAPVNVETDAKWLQVALRQLLTNAIKYSAKDGKVTVMVEALPGGAGRITVSDDGIGVPPEDVPRVFERFFTGANGRLGRASTGMGLYLAAEVCRRLGHELRLESEVGVGTTVTIELRPAGLHRLP